MKYKRINFKVFIYPNPTTDFLTLSVTNSLAEEDYDFSLYTLEGKLLKTDPLTDAETQIDMRSYQRGPYLLKVTDKTQIIKVFKIIKY